MTGPRPLARMIPTIAGKALGRKAMAFGALITDWASIVGPELALRAAPLKLSFPAGQRTDAVLHLRVSGAQALLVQHEEPQILERINGFFGFRAVARLRLVHAPPPDPVRAIVRMRPLSPSEEAELQGRTGGVENEELRTALDRLGRAMLGRQAQ